MSELNSPEGRSESLAIFPAESLPLSEVVSALSFALDLTEDAVPGHAVRSCLLGMRIGQELGLGEDALAALYYALLLKDIGCSSNSARMHQILGGDDRKSKREVKTVDWTRPTPAGLKMAWANALPHAGIWQRARRLLDLSVHQKRNNAEVISLRCERGAGIVRKIGMSAECADAIYSLDEHWNGSGYPGRLRGEAIPLLARILGVAQHLDVFAGDKDRLTAMETLRQRSGSWFDPELVRVAVALERDGALWAGCGEPDERARAVALEPGNAQTVNAEGADRVCEAFADVVDAKSPFTYNHCLDVAQAAKGIARHLGLEPRERQFIYRAGLLHDLGKLRVPNSILDKPGPLDAAEWQVVREHPLLSQKILERVPAFTGIAAVAGRHHERLDGSGYPFGLKAEQLSLEDRIVCVADVYGALTENRPYRKSLPTEAILAIFRKEVPARLDARCFEALVAYMHEKEQTAPQA